MYILPFEHACIFCGDCIGQLGVCARHWSAEIGGGNRRWLNVGPQFDFGQPYQLRRLDWRTDVWKRVARHVQEQEQRRSYDRKVSEDGHPHWRTQVSDYLPHAQSSEYSFTSAAILGQIIRRNSTLTSVVYFRLTRKSAMESHSSDSVLRSAWAF